MSEPEILDLIEKEIVKANTRNRHFSVDRRATRREGNWFYVLVTPEPVDMRVSSYNAAMVKVEDTVARESGVNLVLVPALPD